MLSSLTLISKVKGHVYINIADTDQTVLENELKKKQETISSLPGACFTKYLKPKIFVSSVQTVWNLRKS